MVTHLFHIYMWASLFLAGAYLGRAYRESRRADGRNIYDIHIAPADARAIGYPSIYERQARQEHELGLIPHTDLDLIAACTHPSCRSVKV